ncbi:MAG: pyridoxal phosphate-dependent aminotransferase [Candidatus Hodgkinia cicadicola]
MGTLVSLVGANVNKPTSTVARYLAGPASQTAKAVLKLSSNENPLGPSTMAVQNLRKTHVALERYPSALLEATRAAIAKAYKVEPSNLLLGNGSDELLNAISSLLLKEGDEAIICEHGFLMYRTQILGCGAMPVIVKAKHFGTCLDDIAKAVNNRTKLIYLASPANPSGLCLSERAFWALRRAIPAHVTIVLDLAYADYVTDDRFALSEAKLGDNVVTVRTFSKLYGLAALRIGWMHAKGALVPTTSTMLSPFNVNKVAKFILGDAANDWQHRSLCVSYNLFWTTKVIAQARAYRLNVLDTWANFVTFRLTKRIPICLVRETLSKVGLSVRSTAEYKIFNGMRASLGTAASNKLLLKTLPSVKTTGAIVRTEYAGLFRPSASTWTKSDVATRRSPETCEASASLRPKLELGRPKSSLRKVN